MITAATAGVEATLLCDEVEQVCEATVRDGHLLVEPAEVAGSFGWHLEPRGLCRGDICVPTRDATGLLSDGLVDLTVLASTLGVPSAIWVDPEGAHAAFAMGRSAPDVASSMRVTDAPAVTLPDLNGEHIALLDTTRRKRLLLAFASW